MNNAKMSKLLIKITKELTALPREELLKLIEEAKKQGDGWGEIIESIYYEPKDTPVEYHSKSEMRRVEHMKQIERPKIISNKIKCLKCGDVIESKHVHDFVSCTCGAVSVDGGRDYLKRCGSEWIEMSEWTPKKGGEL